MTTVGFLISVSKATWNSPDIVNLITIFTNYRITADGVTCGASLIKRKMCLVKSENAQQVPHSRLGLWTLIVLIKALQAFKRFLQWRYLCLYLMWTYEWIGMWNLYMKTRHSIAKQKKRTHPLDSRYPPWQRTRRHNSWRLGSQRGSSAQSVQNSRYTKSACYF